MGFLHIERIKRNKFVDLKHKKKAPLYINKSGAFNYLFSFFSSFSFLTTSTTPMAATHKATICSISAGLIATPKPARILINPRHVEDWFNFRISIILLIFFSFIIKKTAFAALLRKFLLNLIQVQNGLNRQRFGR